MTQSASNPEPDGANQELQAGPPFKKVPTSQILNGGVPSIAGADRIRIKSKKTVLDPTTSSSASGKQSRSQSTFASTARGGFIERYPPASPLRHISDLERSLSPFATLSGPESTSTPSISTAPMTEPFDSKVLPKLPPTSSEPGDTMPFGPGSRAQSVQQTRAAPVRGHGLGRGSRGIRGGGVVGVGVQRGGRGRGRGSTPAQLPLTDHPNMPKDLSVKALKEWIRLMTKALEDGSLDDEGKRAKEATDDAAVKAQVAREHADAMRRALEAQKYLSKFYIDCVEATDEELEDKVEATLTQMIVSVMHLAAPRNPVVVDGMEIESEDQEDQQAHNDPDRQTDEDDAWYEDNDGNLMYTTAGGKDYWIDKDGEFVFAEDFGDDAVLGDGKTQVHQAV